eukprot:scaffold167623_cov24-Tisochrysis_lutea.AAC.2
MHEEKVHSLHRANSTSSFKVSMGWSCGTPDAATDATQLLRGYTPCIICAMYIRHICAMYIRHIIRAIIYAMYRVSYNAKAHTAHGDLIMTSALMRQWCCFWLSFFDTLAWIQHFPTCRKSPVIACAASPTRRTRGPWYWVL